MNKNYKKYLKFIQEQKQKHYFNSKKRRFIIPTLYFELESKYIISNSKKRRTSYFVLESKSFKT